MKRKNVKNTKEKYGKMKEANRRKLGLIVLLGVMFLVGVLFSGGTGGGFFKAFVVEITAVLGVWLISVYLKSERYKKGSRAVKKTVHKKKQPENTGEIQIERTKTENCKPAGQVRKNFNWVVKDDMGRKPGHAVRNSTNSGGNLFHREELSEEEKNRIRIDLMNRINTSSHTPPDKDNGDCFAPEANFKAPECPITKEEAFEAAEEAAVILEHENARRGTDDSGQETLEQFFCASESPKAKLHIRMKNPMVHPRTQAPEKVSVSDSAKKTVYTAAPPVDLLNNSEPADSREILAYDSQHSAEKLIDTLASFGVGAKVVNISEGPTVTRFEIQPDYGVKVSKIVNLTDDIALNLAATGVRIEAPIPGKAAIGIEIPNREVTPVLLRDVIESEEFVKHMSKLAFAVGKDIAGNAVIADIAKMPHLLIAGATGSGKSVCINTLVVSILYKALPSEVKLLMVDPKVVELSVYNGIPHLLIPVVTDPKKAAGALNWAVQEMTSRYKLFADSNVRDLAGYNSALRRKGDKNTLPQVVIIIDELADLMMVAPNDVEDCICRLAQMARAAGMHLVIATQRPSVDVITGVIKANIPSRISFAVSSQIDSRTILDMAGAEKLVGKGDMLFNPVGKPKPVRVQGALITDREVEAVVSYIKSTADAQYDEEVMKKIEKPSESAASGSDDEDELLNQVVDMVIEQGQASTSFIQRKFKLGYSRAARILDQLEAYGVVGPFEGSKPRKVLMTRQEWEDVNSVQQPDTDNFL